MRILWLYRYANWYNFDHWFHMDFARILKNTKGIDLVGYGLDLEKGYPNLAFPYNKNLTMEDLKKELNFDIAIINTMSRMFEKYTPPRLEGQELRYNCWLPEDFASFKKTPKIVIEEDYHYQDNDDWYYENGIDLILQRHYSQSLRGQKVEHKWLPFSVDVNTFYNTKTTASRENKICFAGNSG